MDEHPYLAALSLLIVHGEDDAWRVLHTRALDESFGRRESSRDLTERVMSALHDITRGPEEGERLN